MSIYSGNFLNYLHFFFNKRLFYFQIIIWHRGDKGHAPANGYGLPNRGLANGICKKVSASHRAAISQSGNGKCSHVTHTAEDALVHHHHAKDNIAAGHAALYVTPVLTTVILLGSSMNISIRFLPQIRQTVNAASP